MKILVTGANGYLGTGIVRELLNKGHQVISSDISLAHVDERSEKKECNLFEIQKPYEYLLRLDVNIFVLWEACMKSDFLRGVLMKIRPVIQQHHMGLQRMQ